MDAATTKARSLGSQQFFFSNLKKKNNCGISTEKFPRLVLSFIVATFILPKKATFGESNILKQAILHQRLKQPEHFN